MRGWKVLSGVITCLACTSEPAVPATRPPRLVLWAWERPEDLRFLQAGQAEVSFLAATLLLSEDTLSVVPRRQPLLLPQGLNPRATVRLELRPGASLAHVPDALRRRVVERLAALAGDMKVQGLQLDFDARESEVEAYLSFLGELRAALPPGMPLSITALVSWCTPGGWLTRAPVDEVVPQWFRMGAESSAHEARMRRRLEAPCAHSLGVALDEWRQPPASATTVYLFNPLPWTATAFQTARARVTP